MKARLLFVGMILSTSTFFAQDLSSYQLIAHYPFSSDGNDATTNYGAATTDNVSYAMGGVYSNGTYGAGGSFLKTPNISGLNASDFAISLSFNPDEVPDSPVLMVGNSWRWLHCKTEYNFSTSSNTLSVTVSKTNGFGQAILTTQTIQPSTWYDMTILYNAAGMTLSVYVNGQMVGQGTLDAAIAHNSDFDFVNQDGGLGETFKGHWKDLKVYNKSATASIETLSAEEIQVFPNPVTDELHIKTSVGSSQEYTLVDGQGRTVLFGELSGPNSTISVGHLVEGMYFLRLGDQTVNVKISR